jgi:formylmethanofuran dehydrogenase subunit E
MDFQPSLITVGVNVLLGTQRWERRFKEAAQHHGDKCAGLAIGVRALDVVERELNISKNTSALEVKLGTKKCLGDAFEALLGLEKRQIEYVNPRNDVILVTQGTDAIELHLTPTKIMEVANVFQNSDEDLFPLIRRLKVNMGSP